jgi:hypothetical protein
MTIHSCGTSNLRKPTVWARNETVEFDEFCETRGPIQADWLTLSGKPGMEKNDSEERLVRGVIHEQIVIACAPPWVLSTEQRPRLMR